MKRADSGSGPGGGTNAGVATARKAGRPARTATAGDRTCANAGYCSRSAGDDRKRGLRAEMDRCGRLIRRTSAAADGLVQDAGARPAVARRERPVPHLGFRDHAAADAGGRGDRALQRVPAPLSDAGVAVAGGGGGCSGSVVGAGVLPPGADAAQGGAVHRAGAGRAAAGQFGGAAHAAGDRGVYRRGDCEHRVWGGGGGGGWQCGARDPAADGAAQRGDGRGTRVYPRAGAGADAEGLAPASTAEAELARTSGPSRAVREVGMRRSGSRWPRRRIRRPGQEAKRRIRMWSTTPPENTTRR